MDLSRSHGPTVVPFVPSLSLSLPLFRVKKHSISYLRRSFVSSNVRSLHSYLGSLFHFPSSFPAALSFSLPLSLSSPPPPLTSHDRPPILSSYHCLSVYGPLRSPCGRLVSFSHSFSPWAHFERAQVFFSLPFSLGLASSTFPSPSYTRYPSTFDSPRASHRRLTGDILPFALEERAMQRLRYARWPLCCTGVGATRTPL